MRALEFYVYIYKLCNYALYADLIYKYIMVDPAFKMFQFAYVFVVLFNNKEILKTYHVLKCKYSHPKCIYNVICCVCVIFNTVFVSLILPFIL